MDEQRLREEAQVAFLKNEKLKHDLERSRTQHQIEVMRGHINEQKVSRERDYVESLYNEKSYEHKTLQQGLPFLIHNLQSSTAPRFIRGPASQKTVYKTKPEYYPQPVTRHKKLRVRPRQKRNIKGKKKRRTLDNPFDNITGVSTSLKNPFGSNIKF